MKKLIVATAFILASTQALASGFDITNPFNHATRTELAKETKARVDGDKAVQSNLDTAISQQQANNHQQQTQLNAVQDAAQIANEKGDANAVRADGIEKSLANTDNRSINNAVRLDGVEAKNTAQDQRLDKTNQRVDTVAWTANSNTKRVAGLEAKVDSNDLIVEGHSKQLTGHQGRLDTHDQKFADQDVINAAVGSSLAGLYQDTASLRSEVQQARREAKEAKSFGAIALATAAHQFSTHPDAGFQMALSGATIGGYQAVSIGMGGALNEKWFVNGAVSTSQGVTGGALSVTHSFR